ncbi:19507_t:CDS:2 [Funneliformis geosporum]|uniref:11122_t:CDS:1 n=1 Tax=Funneliformis geosporum TaxID=1117311 RepID=A0A9W4WUQ4_9GLOM|nr:19507_t:CDS:2 [Funneliformis geosporum]CAI2187300.1 11122_t:CDS:2 [Funneliformis geosporum]
MGNLFTRERINKPLMMSKADVDREEFSYVDGRRFHNIQSSKYPLPNDDEECDRLHMQHFLMRYAWQGNFASPIKHILNGENSKILDVGCGAGSWSFEMASNYPNSNVTGVDISPVQPLEVKPKNVTFIQANILDGLKFADETFDFIFQRFLVGGIPKDKWSSVIEELTRMLKPGGYLELMEFNVLSESLGPSSTIYGNALITLCEQRNLESKMVPKLKYYVEQQEQFEEIKEEGKLICGGREAGKLGQTMNEDIMRFYENMKIVMMPILQVTSEEYDEMIKTIKEEWFERNSYSRFVRVYARKIKTDCYSDRV